MFIATAPGLSHIKLTKFIMYMINYKCISYQYASVLTTHLHKSHFYEILQFSEFYNFTTGYF
jgi:hypothetical protein